MRGVLAATARYAIHAPMDLPKVALTMAFLCTAMSGVLVAYAPFAKAAQDARLRAAIEALPQMAAFLASAPEHRACPAEPPFSSGCARFGQFSVRSDGASFKVSWVSGGRYQPTVVHDFMSVDGSVVTVSPAIDRDQMALSLYNELSSHSEEFQRLLVSSVQ